ncbi:MAG: prepilin peptidase [Patescibacteria group bacterium]
MYILGFILGTVLGSLVKALADRSLTNKTFRGRSYCPQCKHKLQWYDLLPIISYLLLRGRCRYCGDRISVEYFLVEVVMGLLIGYLFFQGFDKIMQWPYLVNFQFTISLLDLLFKTFFISVLVVLFLTDIKRMFIPDRIILPSIVIATIFLLLTTLYKIGYLYYFLSQSRIGQLLLPPHSDYFRNHAIRTAEPLIYSIVAAILIGGFFWLLIIITKGKGMGGGDVKLGALMGLVLGSPLSLVALMISFLLGALISVVLLTLGKKHFGESIPFGPFLVSGSLVTLFWGNNIFEWYLHFSFKMGY